VPDFLVELGQLPQHDRLSLAEDGMDFGECFSHAARRLEEDEGEPGRGSSCQQPASLGPGTGEKAQKRERAVCETGGRDRHRKGGGSGNRRDGVAGGVGGGDD